jgi:flavin reductase (DIM6/NTAB) family NADH-FMN oxidoreductase RutF
MNVIILIERLSTKSSIEITDWHWDESVKSMVFEDEKGHKYKGKTHSVVIGKVYRVEIESTPSKDGYISISRWY